MSMRSRMFQPWRPSSAVSPYIQQFGHAICIDMYTYYVIFSEVHFEFHNVVMSLCNVMGYVSNIAWDG